MKIGFVSPHAPDDRRAWSGTNYKLHQALAKRHQVVHVPYRRDAAAQAYGLVLKVLARAVRKNALVDATNFVSRRLARSIDRNLLEDPDVLFFPGGSSCLAGVETATPIVYLTDATFASMSDYYPSFSNLMAFNRAQGNRLEAQALARADRVVVSSDWARSSVHLDYGEHEAKVRTIEFGANLLQDQPDVMKAAVGRRPSARHQRSEHLSLLFMGVEWERKGGDVAIECCRRLRQLGIPARIHLVGTDLPKHCQGYEYVIAHGFFDKNDPQQLAQLESIMAEADIFILPTRAECSPIAFCEASAYGLPVLTTDTGGLSNYVVNGLNGYRLPVGSSGQDFAVKIQQMLVDELLESLSDGAFKMYENKLNWAEWANRFEDVVADLVSVAPSD